MTSTNNDDIKKSIEAKAFAQGQASILYAAAVWEGIEFARALANEAGENLDRIAWDAGDTLLYNKISMWRNKNSN